VPLRAVLAQETQLDGRALPRSFRSKKELSELPSLVREDPLAGRRRRTRWHFWEFEY